MSSFHNTPREILADTPTFQSSMILLVFLQCFDLLSAFITSSILLMMQHYITHCCFNIISQNLNNVIYLCICDGLFTGCLTVIMSALNLSLSFLFTHYFSFESILYPCQIPVILNIMKITMFALNFFISVTFK